MITWAELRDQFCSMGVTGRPCQFHASARAVGPVDGGPKAILDALVSAVGSGVLLAPTFNFHEWTERGYFDVQNTPSGMGWLTELARLDGRFVRTPHPVLSFAVAGDGWSKYTLDVPNAHGACSVFSQLVEDDAVMLSFSGKGFRKNDVGLTLSNHAAVLAGAPWRTMKVFEGTYVDGGVASIRKYSASVCLRDKYVTEVTPAHEAAEREGIIKRYPLGHTECLVADARSFVDWAVEKHKTNPELWRRKL